MELSSLHLARTNDKGTDGSFVSTSAQKLALCDSMFAYAGTYTVKHGRVIHHTDMSWNGAWDGTYQIRLLKIDGDRLTYTDAPAKNPLDGRDCVHHVEFVKVG